MLSNLPQRLNNWKDFLISFISNMCFLEADLRRHQTEMAELGRTKDNLQRHLADLVVEVAIASNGQTGTDSTDSSSFAAGAA